jgi:hypothetical protein
MRDWVCRYRYIGKFFFPWLFEIIRGFGFVLPKVLTNNEESNPHLTGYVAV